jgi:hypothetical protein
LLLHRTFYIKKMTKKGAWAGTTVAHLELASLDIFKGCSLLLSESGLSGGTPRLVTEPLDNSETVHGELGSAAGGRTREAGLLIRERKVWKLRKRWCSETELTNDQEILCAFFLHKSATETFNGCISEDHRATNHAERFKSFNN